MRDGRQPSVRYRCMSPVSQLSALFAFHEVMVADLLLPGASGEVGDFDGGVAVGYGDAAELA